MSPSVNQPARRAATRRHEAKGMPPLLRRAYARQREFGFRRLADMTDWIEIAMFLLMVYLLIVLGGCCNAGA